VTARCQPKDDEQEQEDDLLTIKADWGPAWEFGDKHLDQQ